MQNEFVTTSSAQTKKLGAMLALELRGGEIICLSGDLGAGKTTFTQGLLQGLKIKGPYTSPTFVVIRHYKSRKFQISNDKFQIKSKLKNDKFINSYHIDAYRVDAKDILELGWRDFAGQPNAIVIIEWPERIKKIIPTDAVWINFAWISKKERRISF
jgi:tRNA threonylcarbamoyladenosine biosynthesis protein TsaE